MALVERNLPDDVVHVHDPYSFAGPRTMVKSSTRQTSSDPCTPRRRDMMEGLAVTKLRRSQSHQLLSANRLGSGNQSTPTVSAASVVAAAASKKLRNADTIVQSQPTPVSMQLPMTILTTTPPTLPAAEPAFSPSSQGSTGRCSSGGVPPLMMSMRATPEPTPRAASVQSSSGGMGLAQNFFPASKTPSPNPDPSMGFSPSNVAKNERLHSLLGSSGRPQTSMATPQYHGLQCHHVHYQHHTFQFHTHTLRPQMPQPQTAAHHQPQPHEWDQSPARQQRVISPAPSNEPYPHLRSQWSQGVSVAHQHQQQHRPSQDGSFLSPELARLAKFLEEQHPPTFPPRSVLPQNASLPPVPMPNQVTSTASGSHGSLSTLASSSSYNALMAKYSGGQMSAPPTADQLIPASGSSMMGVPSFASSVSANLIPASNSGDWPMFKPSASMDGSFGMNAYRPAAQPPHQQAFPHPFSPTFPPKSPSFPTSPQSVPSRTSSYMEHPTSPSYPPLPSGAGDTETAMALMMRLGMQASPTGQLIHPGILSQQPSSRPIDPSSLYPTPSNTIPMDDGGILFALPALPKNPTVYHQHQHHQAHLPHQPQSSQQVVPAPQGNGGVTGGANVPSGAGGGMRLERFASGALCDHVANWRRLRRKKGVTQMLCRECGAKWKSRKAHRPSGSLSSRMNEAAAAAQSDDTRPLSSDSSKEEEFEEEESNEDDEIDDDDDYGEDQGK